MNTSINLNVGIYCILGLISFNVPSQDSKIATNVSSLSSEDEERNIPEELM